MRILSYFWVLCFLIGCDRVDAKEELATILSYDNSSTPCGTSWTLKGENGNLRALNVPTEFQQNNLVVWIRYEKSQAQRSLDNPQCGFIRLTSVRRQ
jgi:hypothetical protein